MTDAWMAAFSGVTLLVLVLTVVLAGVVRELGSHPSAQGGFPLEDGLAVGTNIPVFTATTHDGSTFDSRSMAGKSHLYVFLSADCLPCRRLLEDLISSKRDGVGADPVIAVLDEEQSLPLEALPPHITFIRESGRQISGQLFRFISYPNAVAVSPSGVVVMKRAVNELMQLKRLAEEANEGRMDDEQLTLDAVESRMHTHQGADST